jgi:hypothetical protein
MFQVILQDYDLHLLPSDIVDLDNRGFILKDSNDLPFVDYSSIIASVRPKEKMDPGKMALLTKAVVRIQSATRKMLAKRELEARRKARNEELSEVGDIIETLKGTNPAKQ